MSMWEGPSTIEIIKFIATNFIPIMGWAFTGISIYLAVSLYRIITGC